MSFSIEQDIRVIFRACRACSKVSWFLLDRRLPVHIVTNIRPANSRVQPDASVSPCSSTCSWIVLPRLTLARCSRWDLSAALPGTQHLIVDLQRGKLTIELAETQSEYLSGTVCTSYGIVSL